MLKAALVLIIGTASMALLRTAEAESLACQTVNGKTACMHGSGSLSCQTVNGRTTCRHGPGTMNCRTNGDRTDCSSDSEILPHAFPYMDPFVVPMPGVPNEDLSIEQDEDGLRIRAGGLDLRIQ